MSHLAEAVRHDVQRGQQGAALARLSRRPAAELWEVSDGLWRSTDAAERAVAGTILTALAARPRQRARATALTRELIRSEQEVEVILAAMLPLLVAADGLVAELARHPDVRVRRHLALGLGPFASSERIDACFRALLALAEDGDPSTRDQASAWLLWAPWLGLPLAPLAG